MREALLRENGLKVTANRKKVLEVLDKNHLPLSAEEIYEQILCRPGSKAMDYSTVYRILTIFTEKNITLKSVGGDKIATYQLNKPNHSHYLICTGCHKKVPIEGCPLDAIGEKLVRETGFRITGHNLEFTGECPECRRKKNED